MYKNDQEAFNQGRKAYFRNLKAWENPYSDNEEQKQWSWDRGFDTAFREDEDSFIPHWTDYRP